MSNNNSQVAHIWAQQTKSSARGSNFWFDGRSIYSYSTEIGRFMDGRPVYTSNSYSVSTSRHQSDLRGAVSHLDAIETSLTLRQIPDDWTRAAPIILLGMLRDVRTMIDEILRARKIEYRLTCLMGACARAEKFRADHVKRGALSSRKIKEAHHYHRVGIEEAQIVTLEELRAIVACGDNGDQLLNVLHDRYGAELRDKITKEREERAKRRDADAARALEEARKLEESIAKWRAGEDVYLPYNAPIVLRVRNLTIETSRGAHVPIDHAIMLHRAIQVKANVIGCEIGEFKVTRLDPDQIVIGCHNIPIAEINRIAAQIGLDNLN